MQKYCSNSKIKMPDLFIPSSAQQNNADQAQVISPTTKPSSTMKQWSNLAYRQAGETMHKVNMFSTYTEQPSDVSFQTQEPNEQILLFLRRDFITNVPWIIIGIILILFPTLLTIAGILLHAQFIILPQNYMVILLAFYYLIVATYIFVNFITWYFNISLITNIRVIDVDFADLVYKNVAETKLTLVQDVSSTQIGVIRTIFDYGDVLIQTASATDHFDLLAIPRPQKVVQVVQNLIGKEESSVT
jgi:hypothetical protein